MLPGALCSANLGSWESVGSPSFIRLGSFMIMWSYFPWSSESMFSTWNMFILFWVNPHSRDMLERLFILFPTNWCKLTSCRSYSPIYSVFLARTTVDKTFPLKRKERAGPRKELLPNWGLAIDQTPGAKLAQLSPKQRITFPNC